MYADRTVPLIAALQGTARTPKVLDAGSSCG